MKQARRDPGGRMRPRSRRAVGNVAVVVLVALVQWRCGPGGGALVDVEHRPRGGAGPAAAVDPGRPTPPVLRRLAPLSLSDRNAWREILQWPASCEDAFQVSRTGDDAAITFFELAPGLALVEVLCAAGSYQPSSVYVRFDERGASRVATLLKFTTYQSSAGAAIEAAPGEAEVWGHATVSPAAREVSVLMLSRQLADCGVWTRHSVDTERPELIAAASRLPCPATPGPPADSAGGHAPRGWRPIRLSK